MRAPYLLALFAALTLVSPAPGMTIAPPRAWLQASPDGRFVYVWPKASWSHPPDDPDIATIQERCKTAGLYRRGDWDAPVWELDLGDQNWKQCWVSNDGVHLIHRKMIHSLIRGKWHESVMSEREQARRALEIEAFTLYANGRLVRTVRAAEVLSDPFHVLDKGDWLEKAEFGPDGRFHVTAKDGNRTVFDPSTGARVEGEGHPGLPITSGERMQRFGRGVDELVADCGWRDRFLAASVAAVVGYALVLIGRRVRKQ